MMQSVLLVDDHAMVRQGLRVILAGAIPGLEFGEADNYAAVIRKVETERWHLAILDLDLPGGPGGLDLIREIKRRQPCPVLIYTMHSEQQFGLRALQTGASAYLSKAGDVHEVIAAAKVALAGGRYISPALANMMAELVVDQRARAPHEKLSTREYQIFRMLASGASIGEIAAELKVSGPTVSTYKARVLTKLSVESIAELVRYAIEHELD